MILTTSKPERITLWERLDSLFNALVLLSWNHKSSRDILDAKVLCSAQLATERISFHLMELVVHHLDAARVFHPEASKTYDFAWEIFIDIRIPFVAVDPPPTPSPDDTEEFFVSDDFRDIEPQYSGDGFTEEYEA